MRYLIILILAISCASPYSKAILKEGNDIEYYINTDLKDNLTIQEAVEMFGEPDQVSITNILRKKHFIYMWKNKNAQFINKDVWTENYKREKFTEFIDKYVSTEYINEDHIDIWLYFNAETELLYEFRIVSNVF